MSGQWKPGDVALWSCLSARHVALRINAAYCPIPEHGSEDHWHLDNGGWTSGYGQGSDFRKFVLIDPEDCEQIERLARAYKATWLEGASSSESTLEIVARQMQAALREFANPTPEEPTGLGAVVRDVNGALWTRYDRRDPQPWWRTSTGDPDELIECRFAYADIAAVEVLSEGVTP